MSATPPVPAATPGTSDLAPTLVVGVGGIGCWIADRVYALAAETGAARDSRIVVLGFDTDDNDISGLPNLQPSQRIRTSTADTVYRVLARNGDQIASWFVDDEELTTDIRQMSLLDGAGAIRMLSRLAFDQALRDPSIYQKVYTAAGSIATQNNRDVFGGRVNVMLVGSIAGGTGSGMYLQAALMLADVLRSMGITPEVRGLFLLPDIVVNGARLAREQIRGVRANAYAALKELNAVSRHIQGLDSSLSLPRPVDLEYAPGRSLQPDGRPFASVVLMDYEQPRGGQLGHNFDAYRELAAQAAFALLFTPIGGTFASRTVNQVRVLHAAAAQGQINRFAGVGVSALVYPEARILDYLCVQVGLMVLEGDWLRLDHEYRDELARFQARVDNGEGNLEKPRLGPFYARKLEQLAQSEGVRFFRAIHRNVIVPADDDRRTPEERFVTYLDALEKHLLEAFWTSNADLRKVRGREALGTGHLSDKDSLAADVGNFERNLRRDFDAVERALSGIVDDLFYTSMLGAAVLSPSEWKDYHLESHLLRGGPHLVQARYFLYKLRETLAARVEALADKRPRETIEKALARDFKPDTPERDTAQDLASELAQSLWTGRAYKNFVRDYREHYNLTQRRIRELGELGLRERVYARLDAYLARLLDVIERFFNDLDDLADGLKLERNRIELEHDAASGLSSASRYLYADRAAKQAVWDGLRTRLTGSATEDQDVNAALGQALFQRFREEGRPGRQQVLAPFSGGELFRRDVIEGFARGLIRDRHGDAYRFTAIQAVRREANLRGLDPQRHLLDLVDLVEAQSQPFLAVSRPEAGTSMRFWALSPRNADELTGDLAPSVLFTRNQGAGALIEPEFPDHTVLCLSTQVNLTLADLAKLDPGLGAGQNVSARQPGVYFSAYQAMVSRALAHERSNPGTPNPVFTPHIHRDWHKPGVLPEIHPELEGNQTRDLMDAYACALALDLLPLATRDGESVTLFRDPVRLGTSGYERVLLARQDDLLLLETLARESGVVAAVLDRRAALASAPMPPDGDALYQGLTRPATLARMGRLIADRTRAERGEAMAEGVIKALFDNLETASERLHRGLGPNERRKRLAEAGEALIAAALAELEAELDDEARGWLGQLARGQLALRTDPTRGA